MTHTNCTCPLCCPSKPRFGDGSMVLFHTIGRRHALRWAKKLRRRHGIDVRLRRSDPALDGFWYWAVWAVPQPWALTLAIAS